MKIEVLREDLLNAVFTAEKFGGKHVSLPILSNIVFFTYKNKIEVRATNLDIGIVVSIDAKCDDEGSFAVLPHAIKTFLSHNSSKVISIEYKENVLVLESSGSRAEIKTENTDDFPIIPKTTGLYKFSLPVNIFVEGVKAVYYSASNSVVKPELSSVYIYSEADELVFVSTDSFRLAEKKVKVSKLPHIEPILIPFKNAVEISKVFEGLKEEIFIEGDKNQITFKSDDVFISSRVVDGSFPDYKQIIPKDFSIEVNFLREDFEEALKLTSGFVDSFQQIIISVSPKNKTMVLKTKGGDYGLVSQEIKVNGKGEDLTVTFNNKYLLDCLQSIKNESLSLSLIEVNKPMVIKEAIHSSFTYLVMPMNR